MHFARIITLYTIDHSDSDHLTSQVDDLFDFALTCSIAETVRNGCDEMIVVVVVNECHCLYTFFLLSQIVLCTTPSKFGEYTPMATISSSRSRYGSQGSPCVMVHMKETFVDSTMHFDADAMPNRRLRNDYSRNPH